LVTEPPAANETPASAVTLALPLMTPAFTSVAAPLALIPKALPVIVPPAWLVTRAPVVSTTPLAAPVTRPALVNVPLVVSVPLSVRVMPAASVLLPLKVQFALASMVTAAKPAYCVPRPLSVPAAVAEASSSVVVPTPLAVPRIVVCPPGARVNAPLPLTPPMKTAPGSTISRLVPPPKMTASMGGRAAELLRRLQGAAVRHGGILCGVHCDVARDQRLAAQVADRAGDGAGASQADAVGNVRFAIGCEAGNAGVIGHRSRAANLDRVALQAAFDQRAGRARCAVDQRAGIHRHRDCAGTAVDRAVVDQRVGAG
jgi:hypothetical protein